MGETLRGEEGRGKGVRALGHAKADGGGGSQDDTVVGLSRWRWDGNRVMNYDATEGSPKTEKRRG